MSDILIAVFSGGVLAAVIEGVREYLSWRRQRKAVIEDREELDEEERFSVEQKRVDVLENKVDALIEAQKFLLYDRIRFFGQKCIELNEIDFDDRRILNDMHRHYHNGLGGNGDLDILMKDVNNLPLRKKGK